MGILGRVRILHTVKGDARSPSAPSGVLQVRMETQTKGTFCSGLDGDVIHALHRQQRAAKGSERQEGLSITIRGTSGGNAPRLQALSAEQSDLLSLSCGARACSVLWVEREPPAAHSQTQRAAV